MAPRTRTAPPVAASDCSVVTDLVSVVSSLTSADSNRRGDYAWDVDGDVLRDLLLRAS